MLTLLLSRFSSFVGSGAAVGVVVFVVVDSIYDDLLCFCDCQ